jgi:predicted phage-related endonuclease
MAASARVRTPISSAAQWHADRRRYIGASEVPIVCGVDGRFASRAILFAEKMGLRPLQQENAAMRRGRLGEGACLEALCDERPDWRVQRAKIHVVDPELRMACTPDAAATRPDRDGIGIVQCKCIARSVYRRKWLDDADGPITGPATPPPAYHLQTLVEMALNETSWGVLAVLIVGEYQWDFQLIEIERNAAVEDRILHDVAEFYREYLDPGIMPPLEPERDEELVRALYPKDNGSTLDLTGDNRALALVEDLVETQAALKRLHKQEAALKVELAGKLGENTYGALADGRYVSWRLQHRKAYAVEASEYRVLRILKTAPRGSDDE